MLGWLKAFWIIFKLALVIATTIWLFLRDGRAEFTFLDYEVVILLGPFLAFSFLVLLAVLALHSFFIGLKKLPKALVVAHRTQKKQEYHLAFMDGLSQLALGDLSHIDRTIAKVEKLGSEDYGFSDFLKGMAALKRGDRKSAEANFQALLGRKQTAFLGLKGLIRLGETTEDHAKTLEWAKTAARKYPDHIWSKTFYMEQLLKCQEWEKALQTLRSIRRKRMIDKDHYYETKAAILMAHSVSAKNKGDTYTATNQAQKALQANPSFLPAVLSVAASMNIKKQHKRLTKVIENTWAQTPHPALLELWHALAPKNTEKTPTRHLKWFEKLHDINPSAVESKVALAEALLDQKLYAEARETLKEAAKLRPVKAVHALIWRLHQEDPGDDRIASLDDQNLMSQLATDKAWVCTDTGTICKDWQAFAAPSASFNSLIWDYPENSASRAFLAANSNQKDLSTNLLIEAY